MKIAYVTLAMMCLACPTIAYNANKDMTINLSPDAEIRLLAALENDFGKNTGLVQGIYRIIEQYVQNYEYRIERDKMSKQESKKLDIEVK